jgi:phosphoribosylformimino-5-aminoimidazole carboxamide ribonucleotide (ProFAR) isomerase
VRLDAVLQALGGDKNKLVIDLSCRRRGEDSWFVAMNKWQTITDMEVNQGKSPGKYAQSQLLTRYRIYQVFGALLRGILDPCCR